MGLYEHGPQFSHIILLVINPVSSHYVSSFLWIRIVACSNCFLVSLLGCAGVTFGQTQKEGTSPARIRWDWRESNWWAPFFWLLPIYGRCVRARMIQLFIPWSMVFFRRTTFLFLILFYSCQGHNLWFSEAGFFETSLKLGPAKLWWLTINYPAKCLCWYTPFSGTPKWMDIDP